MKYYFYYTQRESEHRTVGIVPIMKFVHVSARIDYDDSHYATLMLPTVVRILKFRAADVFAKRGKKHRNEGLVDVF